MPFSLIPQPDSLLTLPGSQTTKGISGFILPFICHKYLQFAIFPLDAAPTNLSFTNTDLTGIYYTPATDKSNSFMLSNGSYDFNNSFLKNYTYKLCK